MDDKLTPQQIDEALKGTKYEGAKYMYWDWEPENATPHLETTFGQYNRAGCQTLIDAKKNAARAVIFERENIGLKARISMFERELTEAKARITELEAMVEWYPMKFAPKDGRRVILNTKDGIIEARWGWEDGGFDIYGWCYGSSFNACEDWATGWKSASPAPTNKKEG